MRSKFSLLLLAVALLGFVQPASAQNGNTISGFVFGVDRQPLSDLNIELLNEYQQTIGRTRSAGSGRYSFNGIPSGRFTIRVFTFATDYEEKETTIEIQNISTSSGGVGGYSNEQVDVYLKLRKGVTTVNQALFAQDIPDEAKKLYEKGISELDSNRLAPGLAALKQAVEAFPKYYAALERLGTEYVRMGRQDTYIAAEYLLTMAVGINPRGHKSWYGLAYSRYSLGKLTEALAAAEKAAELNGYWPEAVVLHGVLLRKAKKLPEAEKQLLKAKELSKDAIPQVHLELGLLYGSDLQRYADGTKELKAYLKAKPDASNSEAVKALIAEFESKTVKTN